MLLKVIKEKQIFKNVRKTLSGNSKIVIKQLVESQTKITGFIDRKVVAIYFKIIFINTWFANYQQLFFILLKSFIFELKTVLRIFYFLLIFNLQVHDCYLLCM